MTDDKVCSKKHSLIFNGFDSYYSINFFQHIQMCKRVVDNELFACYLTCSGHKLPHCNGVDQNTHSWLIPSNCPLLTNQYFQSPHHSIPTRPRLHPHHFNVRLRVLHRRCGCPTQHPHLSKRIQHTTTTPNIHLLHMTLYEVM